MPTDMRHVCQVIPLLLDQEQGSKYFFSDKNKNDRDILAGGRVIFALPNAGDDLFADEGKERFPGIERRDLPCLWVEDQAQQHFTVSLAGLSTPEVGEVVGDLADAAGTATDLAEWKSKFEERQHRRKGERVRTSKPEDDHLANNGDKANEDNDHISPPNSVGLLTSLGRIAGIVGIALGVFYLLLQPLHFPVLDATAARLLMFLVYGVTVVSLVIWAARDRNQRGLALILAAVAIVIAYFGWRGGEDRPSREYQVTITVAKPDGSVAKTNEATVFIPGQNVLGNPDGASWIARIPAEAKGQTFDVRAEISGVGLIALAILPLGEDYAPKSHLTLAPGGEVDVTVLVVDESGFSVPNAIVSVVGGTSEPTDAGGQRKLKTSAHQGELIEVRAQMAPDLLGDKKDYKVGSGPVTLILHHARGTLGQLAHATQRVANQPGAKPLPTLQSSGQSLTPIAPQQIQVTQQTTVVLPPPVQPVSTLRLAINSIRIPDWFEVGEGQNNGNWPIAVILKIDEQEVRIAVKFTVPKNGRHQIDMDSISKTLQLTKGPHTYGFTVEVQQLVSRFHRTDSVVRVPCLRAFTLDADSEVNPFLTLQDTKITQCLLVKPTDGLPQHTF